MFIKPFYTLSRILWVISTISLIYYGNFCSLNTISNKNSDAQPMPSVENTAVHSLNYALDPTATKRLAIVEEYLVSALAELTLKIKHSLKNHLCSVYLHKYITQFNQDPQIVHLQNGSFRADMVTENPNLALRMIRRLVVTLFNKTRKWCERPSPQFSKIVNDILITENLTVSTERDLDEALEGLLRIQFIYGLNATNEVRLGIFQGVKTGAYLDFDDCMALANKALELGGEAIAYQWLVSASLFLQVENQQDFEAHTNKDELDKSWLKLQNITKSNSLNELHNLLREKRQETLEPYNEYEMYAGCRGEVPQPVVNRKHYHCFYQFQWHPYFYINPVRTQLVSEIPIIFQFFDFVGNQTIEFIRSTAKGIMEMSEIMPSGDYEKISSRVRASMSAYFFNETSNPKLITLSGRLEKLTGLEVRRERASESLQFVKYGALAGHFDHHQDSMQDKAAYNSLIDNRLATVFMFLTDVRLGGYTAFPLAGTFLKPQKGSVVLWYNLWRNGSENELTLHGGCPVILGTKEVANRWILQFENMFRKPCSLDSDK